MSTTNIFVHACLLTSHQHANPMENTTLVLHILPIIYLAEYKPHRYCKNKELCYGQNC